MRTEALVQTVPCLSFQTALAIVGDIMTHVLPVAGSAAQCWFTADSLHQNDTQTNEAIFPKAIPPEKAHIKWPVTSITTLIL